MIETFEEPQSRAWVDWTPERIALAEQYAEAGYLSLAAELCDTIMADDRVQGVLPVRARGLLGLPFSFERSARSKRDHKRAEKALIGNDEWWRIAPDCVLAELNTWGILLGVGFAQKLWEPAVVEAASRVLPVLDVWHPRNIRKDPETGRWIARTRGGEVPIEDNDQRWVVHTPGSSKRPAAHAAWRAVSRWVLLKQYARSDWGVEGERSAGIRTAIPPLVTGPIDPKLAEERKANRSALATALKELSRKASITLPAGWDLKVVQSAARTFETYRAQIEIANAGIAIALAGQNLTSEIKGGSFAAAQVHKAIANVLLRGDAEALSTTLHDQVLSQWAAYNLAGGESAAPWPSWDTMPPEDLAAKGAAWSALVDAGTKAEAALVAAGSASTVDWDEIIRLGAIPVRKRAE